MSTHQLDCERLIKLCGLFGSDHAGERANAAAAADRMLRQASLRWSDVIAPQLPGPTRERFVETIEDAIEICLAYSEVLTDWEHEFVESLSRLRYPLSEKQLAVLEKLVGKVRRAEAAA